MESDCTAGWRRQHTRPNSVLSPCGIVWEEVTSAFFFFQLNGTRHLWPEEGQTNGPDTSALLDRSAEARPVGGCYFIVPSAHSSGTRKASKGPIMLGQAAPDGAVYNTVFTFV